MNLDWQKIASVDFERDGALRDIYVLGTTHADWNNVLQEIRKFEPPPVYKEDGTITEMPPRVEDIIERRQRVSPLFFFTVGQFQLNCHFFIGAESAQLIEFDLDPKEMTCPDDLEALADFMRFLAKLTKKEVVLTPENFLESPILKCSPGTGEVIWLPPKV